MCYFVMLTVLKIILTFMKATMPCKWRYSGNYRHKWQDFRCGIHALSNPNIRQAAIHRIWVIEAVWLIRSAVHTCKSIFREPYRLATWYPFRLLPVRVNMVILPPPLYIFHIVGRIYWLYRHALIVCKTKARGKDI